MSVQVSYKKQALFFLLSILFILVILEFGSRIYEYFTPDCFLIGAEATKDLGYELQRQMCDESKLLEVNEFPVYIPKPNQNFTTIHVNSLGFRGHEFNETKNPNKYRIIAVGGSTLWGSGASSDDATIPAFLEKKLRKSGYDVEVINAGVGAADSFEEAYKVRYMYKKYEPDMFIIYDGWNDSFGKVKEGELNPEISRHMLIQQEKSKLQIFISENLSEYRTLYVLHPLFSHYTIAATMTSDVVEKNSEIWSSRWDAVCRENNEEGIETILVLQPIVGTGNKKLTPSEKHHADYIKQIKSREQLESFSKKLSMISCSKNVDLRNVFDDISEPIFFDGGHMTDRGNEIIAEKIFEEVLPIITHDSATNKKQFKN